MRWVYIVLFAIVSCMEQKETRRLPNVILIMTDDQGYGDVGFHGNELIKTPHLDQLASTSFELTNYHSGTTCTPTRAGMLTGRNANRIGAWHTISGASILNDDEQTLGEVFKSNGYSTAMFGKWHLGDSYPYRPHDRGFDVAFYHGGGGVQQTPDYWNNDYFDDVYLRNGKPEQTKGYCTDVWFDETISFISQHKDHPFMIYLATNAAHGPFNVPESYYNLYDSAMLTPRQKRFYGMITNVDDNVGRLIDYLKQSEMFENTIFIFTTDNGTAGGQEYDQVLDRHYGFNPLRGVKGSHYDGGHRVPFLISWPKAGLSKGKSDQLVSHVDLLPTLSSMCQLSFEPKKTLDGTDVSKVFDGGAIERMLIVDTQRKQWPEKYRNPCVMDGQWRLVNHSELYDMSSDFEQQHDLSDRFPDRVRGMKEFYDQWWQTTVPEWRHSLHYVGASKEPLLLTIHDMHPDDEREGIPWNQNQVRQGNYFPSGYFDLKVGKAGMYNIELFRWPPESGKELDEDVDAVPGKVYLDGLAAGKGIQAKEAFLDLNGHRLVAEFTQGEPVIFNSDLANGVVRLKAGFIDPSENELSAYYIRITRI